MKITTRQLRRIIKEELSRTLVQENVESESTGQLKRWLESQGLYELWLNKLNTEPGMIEFLNMLMEQEFNLLKRGPEAMMFERIREDTEDIQTIVYLKPDEILLYLGENANPVTYGSAQEAASKIPEDINFSMPDFSKMNLSL